MRGGRSEGGVVWSIRGVIIKIGPVVMIHR